MILKLKNINVNTIKVLYFLEVVEIDKVLVSKKISSGKKNINTLLVTCVMIIELSHYKLSYQREARIQKVMMVKVNRCIFLLKMMRYSKNIMLFAIKSAPVLKKEFDNKLVDNKKFLKHGIKPYG